MGEGRWNPRLYEGSAPYYAHGRLPYPPELVDALRSALSLDGTSRLLDVGCGPGTVALSLAPLFAEVVGVDADRGMLDEAALQASRRGITNARWVELRAEALPAGLGSFAVATFAQSFHWMERERVAAAVRAMLIPGGAWVHVGATTHEGLQGAAGLSSPSPPRAAIAQLVHRYLGPTRRDGVAGEESVMRAAGFAGPRRITVAGHVHERSEDQVVASVFSLSWATPHLFGARLADFETELRALLRQTSPEGRFAEQARDIDLVIWTKPVPSARVLPEGVFHWTATHPEWEGPVSAYAIDDGSQLVLVDPIDVPDDVRALFEAREVVTVLTSTWHERDAAALGFPVWAPAPDRPEDQLVPATRYTIGDTVFGLEAYPGREGQLDLVLWSERVRAVIAGDTLIDLGNGLEIPASWLPDDVTVEQVAARLRPLLDKPVEFVLPTHGEPTDRAALERALA